MNSIQLFQLALDLTSPWYIERVEFTEQEAGKRQLNIHINFQKGAKFLDENEHECPVHDTEERSWQHLNFFQYVCFLHARIPRIITNSGKVKTAQLPWARPGSRFTLLFEAFAMLLIENEMPVNKAASILNVYPNRLWNIFKYWIARAFIKDDQSNVKKIGIDETSKQKGHDYVTISADLVERRVIFACKGKDENTVKQLNKHLVSKNVDPEQIESFAIDMSPAYISGVTKNFPKASIVFDRFHIVKHLNDAVDEIRKKERKEHESLKGHKYTFLKKDKDLTYEQKTSKYEFILDYPALGEAVRLREVFNDFWDFDEKEEAAAFLAFWCDLTDESNIIPFKKFTNMIRSHWSGIINYIDAKISNGVLEGINSKIQLAKRRARGYRNIDNFISMIYFIAGKLEFDYPHFST
jgi:transposase